MSVKCGHCKGRHVYVSDVRDCADQEAEARWEAEQEAAAERFWEEGTEVQRAQYAWEVEQDELRAFANAGITPGTRICDF